MTYALAAAAAVGTFLVVTTTRRASFGDRIAPYLRISRPRTAPPSGSERPLLAAGLEWTAHHLAVRRALAAGAGALVGMLAAQGDLFIAGKGRSLPGLTALGALAGLLLFNMWLTTRRERRIDRLRQELPTVADALALYVLSGESIATAIDSLCEATDGAVTEELHRVVAAHSSGTGLPEALTQAARDTAHADAARLYTLLGTAHQTGGRLADSLAALAVDYRASLARDLTAQGGRKALTTYGPILALMVPVALLFLMYPTLVGLRELSAGP